MTTFLNYMVEANVCLLIFLALYTLWLRKETNFYFNRIYLLAGLSFSILFPLFHIEGSADLMPTLGSAIPTYWLPDYQFYANEEPSTGTAAGLNGWKLIAYLYFAGTIFCGAIFSFRLFKIIRIIQTQETYTWGNCLVAQTTSTLPTFSFFNFIHIGQADTLNDKEIKEILRHEHAHVESMHSLDILFISFLGIVFWFNPITTAYRKILVQLHEFEADARAVENHDVGVYCNLLARVALQSTDFVIANHFNKSLTLKRIVMMQTIKSKIKPWKLATLALAFPATFFFVACQDQVMEDIKEVTESSNMAITYPDEVRTQLEKLKAGNPSGIFNVIEMNTEGFKKIEDIQEKYSSLSKTFHLVDIPGTDVTSEGRYGILEFSEQVNEIIDQNTTKDQVFSIVEDQPVPKEGYEAFYNFIGQNLKYPEVAKEKGLEGKVYVQFIVDVSGDITDVKAVKGIGGGCDEEAIRVIAMSEDWNPGLQRGQPVKVRMVVPINFALN